MKNTAKNERTNEKKTISTNNDDLHEDDIFCEMGERNVCVRSTLHQPQTVAFDLTLNSYDSNRDVAMYMTSTQQLTEN